MNLRIDSSRLAIVPRLRTSPSGSATATAIVSAWTSNPKNRTFSFMTVPFRLWLCTVVRIHSQRNPRPANRNGHSIVTWDYFRFARDPGGICAKRQHRYRLANIDNRLTNAACRENLFQLFGPVNYHAQTTSMRTAPQHNEPPVARHVVVRDRDPLTGHEQQIFVAYLKKRWQSEPLAPDAFHTRLGPCSGRQSVPRMPKP